MINKNKIQDLKNKISSLERELEHAKETLKKLPDGFIYLLASDDKVINSSCINLDTAIEEMIGISGDELAGNVTLYTNNLKADQIFDFEDCTIKCVSVSELQDLSENNG